MSRRKMDKIDALRTYAEAEAMDVAEDLSEGARVDMRERILEAARDYRQKVDCRERWRDIEDALESAFRQRGLMR